MLTARSPPFGPFLIECDIEKRLSGFDFDTLEVCLAAASLVRARSHDGEPDERATSMNAWDAGLGHHNDIVVDRRAPDAASIARRDSDVENWTFITMNAVSTTLKR